MRINVRDLMSSGLSAQDAFTEALGLCRSHPIELPGVGTLSASGVVYVPAGVYDLTESLTIPLHVRLEGDGDTSVLAFDNGGLELVRQYSDPDVNGDVYATLNYASNVLRDLAVINKDPANEHAGFDMLGGAGVHVERVYTHGWSNHYLLDQAALVSIDKCYLGGINFVDGQPETENGIVFQDPPRAPITKGGSTNLNTVTRCTFNLGGHPIVFKGDVMFSADCCAVNGGRPMVIGGNRASVRGCTFEAIRGDACIVVDAPGGVGAINLEVTGCSFASRIAAVSFDTTVVAGFTFNGNLAATSNKISDDGVIIEQRHVIENLPLQLRGPLVVLGNTNWGDAPMVANDGSPGDVMLYASTAYYDPGTATKGLGLGTLLPPT